MGGRRGGVQMEEKERERESELLLGEERAGVSWQKKREAKEGVL